MNIWPHSKAMFLIVNLNNSCCHECACSYDSILPSFALQEITILPENAIPSIKTTFDLIRNSHYWRLPLNTQTRDIIVI